MPDHQDSFSDDNPGWTPLIALAMAVVLIASMMVVVFGAMASMRG